MSYNCHNSRRENDATYLIELFKVTQCFVIADIINIFGSHDILGFFDDGFNFRICDMTYLPKCVHPFKFFTKTIRVKGA